MKGKECLKIWTWFPKFENWFLACNASSTSDLRLATCCNWGTQTRVSTCHSPEGTQGRLQRRHDGRVDSALCVARQQRHQQVRVHVGQDKQPRPEGQWVKRSRSNCIGSRTRSVDCIHMSGTRTPSLWSCSERESDTDRTLCNATLQGQIQGPWAPPTPLILRHTHKNSFPGGFFSKLQLC